MIGTISHLSTKEINKMGLTISRKGEVVQGLGPYSYNIKTTYENVAMLTCDKSHPSSRVNHSCKPNVKFFEVSSNRFSVTNGIFLSSTFVGFWL